MSKVVASKSYIFHTDLGAVVTTIKTVERYDVEDIIKDRAISQARAIQFFNQAQASSPNDQTAPRTLPSAYTQTAEELPE